MTEPGTWDETTAWLPTIHGPVLAVVTTPRQPAGGAVVLCPGGWHGTGTNRNRLLPRLARRLATEGRTVLRMDWHGVGESHGELSRYDLATPFVEEVGAAVDHLAAAGHARVTLVGVCFGANSALAAAPSHVERLDGVALVSFPVPDRVPHREREVSTLGMLRLAADPALLQTVADPSARRLYRRKLRTRWRRSRGQGGGPVEHRRPSGFDPAAMRERLEHLVGAGVPTLMAFGENDPYLHALARHRESFLDALVERSAGLLVLDVHPVDLQGFGTLAAQATAIEVATAWVRTASVATAR